MQCLVEPRRCVTDGIRDAVLYLCPNQWRDIVKQYGAVFVLEEARAVGSQAAVGVLVVLPTSGMTNRQGYVRLAFAPKHVPRLVHRCGP